MPISLLLTGALMFGILQAEESPTELPSENITETESTPEGDSETTRESKRTESTESSEITPANGAPDFNRELLSVEEEVNDLKEQVFRSKATLKLLREIVIQGAASGSRATVWHVNNLGSAYVLESVSYFLDGKGQYAKSDTSGALNEQEQFQVFDGPIPPGNHTLTVNMKLRGNGFGIFNYVNKYTFNVQSMTVFTAEEGQSCQIKVITNERSGVSTTFVERPYVEFEPRCRRLSDVE
jgi:hypothetical protein